MNGDKPVSLDSLSNLYANLISGLVGLLAGIGSMWFSKVSKKEFNSFGEIITGKIDRIEQETEELKNKIYQKLIDLSADVAVIKDREK